MGQNSYRALIEQFIHRGDPLQWIKGQSPSNEIAKVETRATGVENILKIISRQKP